MSLSQVATPSLLSPAASFFPSQPLSLRLHHKLAKLPGQVRLARRGSAAPESKGAHMEAFVFTRGDPGGYQHMAQPPQTASPNSNTLEDKTKL